MCVFAKPPVAGRVKTRLAAEIGPEAAARLAGAFLEDVLRHAGGLPWAHRVLAWDGAPEDAVATLGPEALAGFQVVTQGDGDLGARLERVLAGALSQGFPFAIALGTDSPGLPPHILETARTALDAADAADAVLGPSDDGGFYLLGLRRAPPGILAGLPWSVAGTYTATRARLAERDMHATTIAPWFDVDLFEDLARLRDLLAAGAISAPATARALGALGTLRAPDAPRLRSGSTGTP